METTIVKNRITFKINDIEYSISETKEGEYDVPIDMSLLIYIREYAKLPGTKAMCYEGGCGACIVATNIKNSQRTIAVNSCLVPILICHGWQIYTIEGIGNRQIGYHVMQKALANKNGSQCGYCSPGMVMMMMDYLRLTDKNLNMQKIENSFGGNICRCTGYRAILDAFKEFADDAPSSSKNICDIEELHKNKACQKYKKPCTSSCDKQLFDGNTMLHIKLADSEFYKVSSIEHLFAIFEQKPNASYILHGGNTAHGVYRTSKKDLYIDINDISDLRNIQITKDSLVLGGNLTLTTALETFQKYSTVTGFKYLSQLAQHVDMIANLSVRNIGSIAGNLMIKYEHKEFPSDLFLILETIGTQLHVLESPSQKYSCFLYEFLQKDMYHKVIYSIVLPSLSDEYVYKSYKIMPRAQNAHIHVNAGFLFKLDTNGKVLERPNIIFGGINKDFLHADNTELLLVDKSIFNNVVLNKVVNTLYNELQPDHVLPDYSPDFRRTLSVGLFYKFILSIKPEVVYPTFRSGASLLERGLSSGKQEYEINKDLWPVNEPIAKLESIEQTSGETQYCNDLPSYPREVFCAFVVTKVANGKISSISAKKALKLKGVVAFFSAEDVPGKNLCISALYPFSSLPEDELLFAEKDVLYAGQPVGVIVAETHHLANEAAQLVEIIYSESLKTKPIISIQDAIDTQDDTRIKHSVNIPAKKKGDHIEYEKTGFFKSGSQYHYSMETQSCVCIPVENGMDVFPSSQWMDLIQVAIANCLDVRHNSINVNIRPLGGAHGSKISRNAQISCACALVCHKLKRPARFVMSIESNMQSIGKRYSTQQSYEFGVDKNGVIQYLTSNHWGNCGSNFNEPQAAMVVSYMQSSCYATDTWSFNGFEVRTDIPSNTLCRASASMEAIAMMENIMEHIAAVTNNNPVEVRLANMNDADKSIFEIMIKDFSKSTNYETRKQAVKNFNVQNRWKKKGIAMVTMKYPVKYMGQFNATVSICARDGSVCVTVGGIEDGQGINTKIVQIVAHVLGIDLKLISVKQSNNLITPNNSTTAGTTVEICGQIAQITAHVLNIDLKLISVKQSNNLMIPNNSTTAGTTVEICGQAVTKICLDILGKLEPIKEKMDSPSWKELIFEAYQQNVDLSEHFLSAYDEKNTDEWRYDIYGVTIAEVEIDVLTGQHIIRRVDLIEDTAISLNPEIDVCQVEGAFVMGIGYWTSEDLIYDPKTGMLTNDKTWNYNPPGAKDIPEDFRVTLKNLNSINTPGKYINTKTTNEPPVCMSCVIPIAIRNALNSARADAGSTNEWNYLEGPYTTERILLNSLTDKDHMKL